MKKTATCGTIEERVARLETQFRRLEQLLLYLRQPLLMALGRIEDYLGHPRSVKPKGKR